MRRIITIFTLCVGILVNADAQTFTQRIQQPANGQGTVTVHESAEIDQLVNSATLTTKSATPSTTGTAGHSGTSGTTGTTANTGTTTTTASATLEAPSETEAPIDNTKKVMRGYKVSGYRVQAFAGGNSRKDRLQAEQIGNEIKSHFAGVPVYVHFYSPRWICRVGNYRTYEEAHQMLLSLRKLGYTQATIVKGKITVPY